MRIKKIFIFQLDNYALSPFSRNLFNLAPELQIRNCDITLITTSELGMESLPSGVHGHLLGTWIPRWLKLPRHYLVIPQLAAYIRRERPNAIIARGVPFSVPTILARALSGLRPLVISTLHSSISGDVGTKVYRSWPLFKILARFAINRSDHTVTVSGGVARDYAETTGIPLGQFQVVYNPVVGANLLELAAEKVTEPWLEQSRKHSTLLHVGRFVPEKDHVTLLQAVAEVRRHRDVRLLLIGDGPLRPMIASAIAELGLSDAVKILGRQDNPYAYMTRVDALVLSSRFEGLPGVLIQAMAVGCPVVSTRCPGAEEILDGGKYGPLCPVGDYRFLARGIMSVLQDPVEHQQLVLRSQTFSASRSADQIIKLLEVAD